MNILLDCYECINYFLKQKGRDLRLCSEGLRHLLKLRDFYFIFAYCSERNSVTRGFSFSCPQSRRNVGIASKRFGLATSQSV